MSSAPPFYAKYRWGVLAKDYNSPLFRNYIWTTAFFRHPKLFGIPRSVLGIISEKGAMRYVGDLSTWATAHEALAARIKKDYRFAEKVFDETNRLGERMNAWSKRMLYKPDLSRFSNEKLWKLYTDTIDWESRVYAYGILIPLLDFQSFSFIEGNLKKFLAEQVSSAEYGEYYRVFTEPAHNSFAQDQEEALLKLCAAFYNDESWRRAARAGSLADMETKFPAFWKKLLKHAERWGWVYYVYAGPAFGPKEFLGFIQLLLEQGIVPAERLTALRRKRAADRKLKAQFIKKLAPDAFYKAILNMAGTLVWAKPRRKDYQSRTYFHSERLMREIGNRLSLSVAEVRATPPPNIRDALLGGKLVDKSIPAAVYNLHVCLPRGREASLRGLPTDAGDVVVLYGTEAEEFRDKYLEQEAEEKETAVTEVKGTPACRGKASGIVKIINVPEDMGKMNVGDILVSVATTPSVVPAMKKAVAIVTDEGGLTCHAAIVSREMGTPCVVGTKIATKVLKDGDTVEVDAERGIIKFIKN